MRVVWRALVVLVVFLGVGLLVGYGVMGHVRAAGAAEPEVRLSAAAAGLFVGGLSAVIALIAVLMAKRGR
jgi:hypothetical protein